MSWVRQISLLASLLFLAATAASASVALAVVSPPPHDPIFGVVELEVEVYADEAIERVEFFVDGKLVGSDRNPPYKASIDVGYDNQEHQFRFVAHTVQGDQVEETVSTPPFAIDQSLNLKLQQFYVTVPGHRRSDALAREQFVVQEDGQRQDIVTFERGEVPITAVLLLDSSESMQDGRLDTAIEAAKEFTSGLEELDQGMVVLFSDRLLRRTEFTSNQETLDAALRGAAPAGGTALNDHLYFGLKELDRQPGRPVIVLFSDGADAHSTLPMEDVIWTARRSQAMVYWVRLVDSDDPRETISSSWRNSDKNRREAELLRDMVRESGGEIQDIRDVAELSRAFRAILEELRGQYVLGYYSSSPRYDGSWRQVKINVRGVGLRARHRGGYVDH